MGVKGDHGLLVFSLFLEFVVLHSAEGEKNHPRCPPYFCNEKLGNLSFPFKSTTHLPECGLFTVDCSDPNRQRIQLKEEGYWHEFEGFPMTNTISINDKGLQERFNRTPCDDQVFNDSTLPSLSPIFQVLFTPNVTLFKCSNTLHNTSNTYLKQACINPNYTYYISITQSQISLPNPDPTCSIIQIPVRSQPPYGLSSLNTEYSLQAEVNEECIQCYERKGQCLLDKGKFKCSGGVKGRNLRLKLGLGMSLPAAALLVVGFLILWRCKQIVDTSCISFSKNQSQNLPIVEAFLRSYGPLPARRYSYLEVNEMTNSFKEKLGQGGYGSVFKGKLNDGCLVAVKVLSKLKGNGEEFMNEVAAVSRTSHVNVVSLLGFCFDGSERALIYEFMPNGSLEKFIFDANNPQRDHHLGWEKLDRISLGIARGLEYLHRGCNTRILHFDIKPHNILLDENFAPKISDFGLAKICNRKESIVSMLGARGTAGYIAPEVFSRSFGAVSHKSDVYSYGMMLSEMVGGRRNIDSEVEDTSEMYFPHWIYKRLELDEELGLQNIMNEEDRVRARKMIIVSLWCIQTAPTNRPAMKEVIDMLEGSVDSLQIPPTPYLSSPQKSLQPDSSSTLVT